jgi:hypothetical protein
MAEIILGSIEHLHGKITSWTQAEADIFHGPAEKAYPKKANYIWTTENTDSLEGFVHYGPGLAVYYTADGHETVLTSLIEAEEGENFDTIWKANVSLYNICNQRMNVRMVNPIGVRLGLTTGVRRVTLDNTQYVHYKVLHPNNELGQLVFFPQSFDDYIQGFIDDTTELLSNIKSVVDSSTGIGYPSIKMNNRLIDSNGTYWRLFFRWNISAQGCFARITGELQKALQFLERNGWTGSAEAIESQAREKWQTALNI